MPPHNSSEPRMEFVKARLVLRKSPSKAAIHVPAEVIVDQPPVDAVPVVSGHPVAALPTSQPPAAEAAAAPAKPAPVVLHVDLVQAIITGEIQSTDPANVSHGLPTNGAELAAAGGPDRFIQECLLLLRADYPIFAFRRLKALDAVCAAAGEPALGSLGDRRVDEIFSVDRQMASTLDAMLDEDSWQLVSTKKELSVHTYLRMGKGGRMDIKVRTALLRYRARRPLIANDRPRSRRIAARRIPHEKGSTSRGMVLPGNGSPIARAGRCAHGPFCAHCALCLRCARRPRSTGCFRARSRLHARRCCTPTSSRRGCQ